MFKIEELEERFELAALAMTAEEGDNQDGCCSGSCCIVGGNCTPSSGTA